AAGAHGCAAAVRHRRARAAAGLRVAPDAAAAGGGERDPPWPRAEGRRRRGHPARAPRWWPRRDRDRRYRRGIRVHHARRRGAHEPARAPAPHLRRRGLARHRRERAGRRDRDVEAARMIPRALVADDEAHLAAHLQDRLRALWPELELLPAAANGLEALRAIEEDAPQVAFLDIRMPGLTGLELAARLGGDTHVVFVTAYDQYAVEAFEREAVDYILKPVTDE